MRLETGSEAARSKDGGAGEQLTSGGGEKRDPATGFLSRGRPLKIRDRKAHTYLGQNRNKIDN